jgi:hypothetical protein
MVALMHRNGFSQRLLKLVENTIQPRHQKKLYVFENTEERIEGRERQRQRVEMRDLEVIRVLANS